MLSARWCRIPFPFRCVHWA